MLFLPIVRLLVVLSAGCNALATINNRQASAGATACASLTSALGNKVESNHIALDYLLTKEDYWNAKQSNYWPACIVYPTSAQDVSIALPIIKSAGSRFAIKAGGHNPNTFFSSVDQGVLISLEKMTVRTYDQGTTLATYQPGGTFGDIYQYYAQFNRTVVGARLGGIGTGLALGGGLSYLSGQYGLAADSFRELEIVLPNGTIATANAQQNQDLFFACKGGGGNAYGVVTKYTVQSRPTGVFYAGNLVFSAQHIQEILYAIGNFTLYNQDPKAAIIGTAERNIIPDPLGLGLDASMFMFLVYDGPDPGHAFDNFTKVSSIVNTLGQKSYLDVINMPVPKLAELTRGNNIFRVQAFHVSETDSTYLKAYNAFSAWCTANKGSYLLASIDYQPIPKSLTDASYAQGGNALQSGPGPYFWLNYLINTTPGLSDAAYTSVQNSFRDMVNSVPSSSDIPLFANDASYDQNPLKSYRSYPQLQATKKRYDPDGFFANFTGGWNFNA